MISELDEGDAFALLTDLRSGLQRDGYELELIATTPHVDLAIRAGADACEDCLVGKSLMTTYVVTALKDASPDITHDDVRIRYPNEHDPAGTVT